MSISTRLMSSWRSGHFFLARSWPASSAPYAVILVGATLGASWSLGGQELKSNTAAARHFILLGATAMLVTVPVANGLAQWIGMSSSTWMLVPIAILIGSVGDAWPRVGRWALALAGRVIERRSGGGGSGQ